MIAPLSTLQGLLNCHAVFFQIYQDDRMTRTTISAANVTHCSSLNAMVTTIGMGDL
jgi:hypothetical protein